MKIAVASDDGKTIAHHFGRAKGFKIFEIKDKKIVKESYRKNIGKSSGECGSCDHATMINTIKDCDIVVSYGMGRKIYEDLLENEVTPVVTEESKVDKAIRLFLDNTLTNRTDKLH